MKTDPCKDLISDDMVSQAFENTNFGITPPRDVIRFALLKYASGYQTGRTARLILIELSLLNESKLTLTKLGKQYLYEAFSQGNSY